MFICLFTLIFNDLHLEAALVLKNNKSKKKKPQ